MRNTALEAQRRLQLSVDLSRAARIFWLFPIGLFFSIAALVTSIARFEDEGSPVGKIAFLGFFCVFFGLLLVSPLNWLRLKPRIIPYFVREIEPYGRKSTAAFGRGRGLYQEIVALDQLARTLGVKPLSEFGFADDFYHQEVHWHSPSDGVNTAEALERGLTGDLRHARDVAGDLTALASVLRVASEQGVEFSLVLRIGKDSLQAVSTMEGRQGRFW